MILRNARCNGKESLTTFCPFLQEPRDCAKSYALCYQPFTVTVQIQPQVSPCGTCGGQSDTRAATSLITLISPVSLNPPMVHIHSHIYTGAVGQGQRSWYSDSLRAGWSRNRIPVRARFSTPVQTGPEAHPASYTMGTGSFPGVKWPGHDTDHPPHSVEVKERVGLYLYSPSGLLWPVLG